MKINDERVLNRAGDMRWPSFWAVLLSQKKKKIEIKTKHTYAYVDTDMPSKKWMLPMPKKRQRIGFGGQATFFEQKSSREMSDPLP